MKSSIPFFALLSSILMAATVTAPADDSFINVAGMSLVKLPGGLFIMGSDSASSFDDEKPAHYVTLSSFYIGRCEVTYGQWLAVKLWAETNGYSFTVAGEAGYQATGTASENPVVSVPWVDALKWCNALSELEGRTPAYYLDSTRTYVYRAGNSEIHNSHVDWQASGYRLPTEAEWEYACRGNSAGNFYWGNVMNNDYEWWMGNAIGTHAIGSKVANPFGLLDMAGNVHETVWDVWPSPYVTYAVNDPHGADGGGWGRVTRGGSFLLDSHYCMSFARRGISAIYQGDFDAGFRPALAAVATPNPTPTPTPTGTPIPRPDTPGNVTASAGIYSNTVLISWSAAARASLYEVRRDGTTAVAQIGISAGTSYFDNTVSPGAMHTFFVVASNASGYSGISTSAVGYAAMPEVLQLPAAADFDGDGRADPSCFNTTNGVWTHWLSGNAYARATLVTGVLGSYPIAADFDGDGRAELGFYSPFYGWYVRLWNGVTYQWVGPYAYVLPNSTPVCADFDGDQKADPALVSPAGWTAWLSGLSYQPYGPSIMFDNDDPAVASFAGDFDADGKADPGRFDTYGWWLRLSAQSYAPSGPYTLSPSGLAGTAMAADFDGDGRSDPAFMTGQYDWYVWLSSEGYQRVTGPARFSP